MRLSAVRAIFKIMQKTNQIMKYSPKLSVLLAGIAVFLFANLVFTACKKEALTQSASTEQNTPALDLQSLVSIEHGVLSFKDCEDLKKVFNYLSSPTTPRNILSKTFSDFVSLEDAYGKISKIASEKTVQPSEYEDVAYWSGSGDEMSFERMIENPLYAMIFNHEGLIKMDGNWIKHLKDEIFIYPAEYSDISLRNAIQPIHHIDMRYMVKERMGNCETVYATQNGNQWKKVVGSQSPGYYLYCVNSICTIVPTNDFAIETKSRKRGLLGAWYAYSANRVGINGVGSSTNVSSYAGNGAFGSTCFVTDVNSSGSSVTGTCNPF